MRLACLLLVVVLDHISPTVKKVRAHTLLPDSSGHNQQEHKNSSVAHTLTEKVGKKVIAQEDLVL